MIDNQSQKSKSTHQLWQRINNISQNIAPASDLSDFVSINPLSGRTAEKFDEANQAVNGLLQSVPHFPDIEKINAYMIKILSSFCDEGQAMLTMPGRDKGLYQAWRQIAPFDKQLNTNATIKKILMASPENAEAAIEWAFNKLNIPLANLSQFIEVQYLALPGWTGFLKMREMYPKNGYINYQNSTRDYLALRAVICCCLFPEGLPDLKMTEISNFSMIHDLKKEEGEFHQSVQAALKNNQFKDVQDPLKAQFIFCIDVRSHQIRHHLEQVPGVKTFGAAGFFNLPIAVNEQDKLSHACPIIVQPATTVQKTAKHNHIRTLIEKAHHQLKYGLPSCFVMVEALGLWMGLLMLLKCLFPRIYYHLIEKPDHVLEDNAQLDENQLNTDFAIDCAEAFLSSIDLTKNFAKVIYIMGHEGQALNTPYLSALHCGACGGHSGKDNALLMSHILNHPNNRAQLAQRGIDIPSSTRFIAGVHNTTANQCRFLEKNPTNDSMLAHINHIGYAGKSSMDWSEVRPEWGLVNNAGFVIGGHEFIQDSQIIGRCFLHSYSAAEDTQADILANILNGPAMVAHWINMQYFYASCDNTHFGAGSKTTHSVMGCHGVIQGCGSDLMVGLPLQSVNQDLKSRAHQYSRLHIYIDAPVAQIEAALEKAPGIKQLNQNHWVKIFCLDRRKQMLTPIHI